MPGADALVLAVGGIRQHPIVMVDDRRHRVKDLAEGEVCVYSHLDEAGNLHRILLNKNRGIELRCGDSSIVMTPTKITLSAQNRIEVVQV